MARGPYDGGIGLFQRWRWYQVNSKTADEIRGTEYDWIAADADGHVALFTTAGGGYAPEEFLQDTDAHDDAIAAILASPAVTTARFSPELGTDFVNTWRLVAERGLFAYDADIYGGPYRLDAAPEVPIRIHQLPAIAARLLGRLTFQGIRFAETPVVSEETLQNGR